MNIRPAGTELFHANGRMDGRTDGWMDGRTDGWMDGRTDMMKLIDAFRNFANAPKIPLYVAERLRSN